MRIGKGVTLIGINMYTFHKQKLRATTITFSPESEGRQNTRTDKNVMPTQGMMTLTV